MGPWIAALACLCAFAVSALLDPRTVRTGVLLLSALVLAAIACAAPVLRWLGGALPDTDAQAWVLLGGVGVLAASVVVLGVVLVLNGLTVVRREGRSPGHLLSLVLGLGVLVQVALAVVALSTDSFVLATLLLLAALPLGWCGYGLVAHLLWSWVYGLWTSRFGGPVDAVVVLGASVRRGVVGPLLAARIDQGLVWVRRQELMRPRGTSSRRGGPAAEPQATEPPGGRPGPVAGRRPVLVLSGGRGPDEPFPEAEAMAAYAVGHGADGWEMLLEDRSTTTRENLEMSAELLAARGPLTRVAVVTSSFHAFRAALVMRSIGMPGYSVGARTARYYRPTAVLREYVAVMRDNLRVNVVGLGLSVVPLVVWCVSALTGA